MAQRKRGGMRRSRKTVYPGGDRGRPPYAIWVWAAHIKIDGRKFSTSYSIPRWGRRTAKAKAVAWLDAKRELAAIADARREAAA